MTYIKDQSRGNYRHYYTRRRATDQYPLPLDRDERIHLLDPSLFRGKVVLDVGCNSGEVAVELAQRYEPSKVIGVDIDSALIDQCQYTVEHAFSLQKPSNIAGSSIQPQPSASVSDASTLEPTRKKRKVKNGTAQDVPSVCTELSTDFHYFPSFFPELYGPIDFRGVTLLTTRPKDETARDPASNDAATTSTSSSHQGKGKRTNTTEGSGDTTVKPTCFPKNLVFYSADWTNASIETDQAGYDVILGFSLTKWIHLHDGDEGLVRFFRKCYNTLNQGGALILEKQGYKGYKQAKRASETLKKNYQSLKLRPETDFDRVLLEDIGFSKKEIVKETETEKGFDRDIEMYWKLSTRLQPA